MIVDSATAERPILRDELVRLVELELVGPQSPNETIDENPQKLYVCGQLAPLRDEDLEDEETFASESLAGANESDVNVDFPSDSAETQGGTEEAEPDATGESNTITQARRDSLTSIGISFAVEPGQIVNYSATWGEYSKDSGGSYVRAAREANGSIEIDGPQSLSTHDHGRASIRWIVRAAAGRMIASVFLGNKTREPSRDGTERLYQVVLQLSCDIASAGFLTRSSSDSKVSLDVNELLYRERREFGVGLNTAVEPLLHGARCFELTTRTIPFVETRITKSNPFGKGSDALDMTWLAKTRDPETACNALEAVFSQYSSWVAKLAQSQDSLAPRFRALATAQITKIDDRIRRLSYGLSLLRRDRVAYDSFRFANETMARARFRIKNRPETGEAFSDKDRSGVWHPFQIAFLISSLADVAEPQRAERDLVDVLFFPTGGGKTEAYLGLAAFAMAFRRLSGIAANGGAGVSTLMRYTLRLLTTQQFSRAATLICAAESVRRDNTFGIALGSQPFGIGLWVGPMTPNTYADALAALKTARNEHRVCARDCSLSQAQREFIAKPLRGREAANVLPITECPWCFTPICIDCVELDTDAKRMVIRCANSCCTFSRASMPPGILIDGLPIYVVDEDVYRMTPTIVVATVDKFATIPFRAEAKSLFGRVSAVCEVCGFLTDSTEHRGHKDKTSPVGPNASADVIIQDELHTITDNLGSIYGLYETAIDYLYTDRTIKPKYICATATVKNVEKQISALYGGRRAAVFPPTGFDAGDTFFSRDSVATVDERGRTYVGIYAPAFSRLSLFVAVLSAILAIVRNLRSNYGDTDSDPYMTLLGYFNTVRDLGGIKALLGDDVPPVLERIAGRHSWETRILVDWENELTGRIAASEVPDRLRLLDSRYVEGVGCDFMAATNMISVGVDVPRLGLMLVDGQPKSTSEYIQATSRVGRTYPGVVFVVYNSMRPRDVSHYEHFYSYHDAMYKFVEAGSITPFSDGAIDRYLRAALVACYRMLSSRSDNASAHLFNADPDGIVSGIISAFSKRASDFGEHEINSAASAIEELVQAWRSASKDIRYHVPVTEWNTSARNRSQAPVSLKHSVLKAADEPESSSVETLFSAARSMRNVEGEVPLLVHLDG